MLYRRAAPLFAMANHLQSHPTPCAACIALRLLHKSPTHLLHSRPALKKARTSHAGESAAADLPPYTCPLLRTSASPAITPGGLRTSRTPPTAKPQAEPSPGAADLANSGAAPATQRCRPRPHPPRAIQSVVNGSDLIRIQSFPNHPIQIEEPRLKRTPSAWLSF